MNKIFVDHIGTLMEIYIEDMLVKTIKDGKLLSDLETIFNYLRKHNMRLNPHKCVFAIEVGKFLGFMLIHRGIKANPDKCWVILETKSSTSVKEVQRLIGRITSLSWFLAASTWKMLLFFHYSKKKMCSNGHRSMKQHIKNSRNTYLALQFWASQRSAKHSSCTYL